MKTKNIYIGVLLILILILLIIGLNWPKKKSNNQSTSLLKTIVTNLTNNQAKPAQDDKTDHPMAIANLRAGSYPGGDFVIEQKLANGTNYSQAIVSYLSEGLKIYGLLTVPLAPMPEGGWPAIMFVHGYIPPKEYSTTGNYPTYQAKLARAGFVTFKPDLRGHGKSEGEPVMAHYSEKYVVDTLYAINYLKQYPVVNPTRLGYWGHSNGGEIGLRVLVISKDIKAASLWAGVVGSYQDMFETYNAKIDFLHDATSSPLIIGNGLPSANTKFWSQLDPYTYLADISAKVELQHGTADDSVPVELSRSLKQALEKNNITPDYYEYLYDNHNIGNNVNKAFERSIKFYKENL